MIFHELAPASSSRFIGAVTGALHAHRRGASPPQDIYGRIQRSRRPKMTGKDIQARLRLFVLAALVAKHDGVTTAHAALLGYRVRATEEEAKGSFLDAVGKEKPGYAVEYVLCMEVPQDALDILPLPDDARDATIARLERELGEAREALTMLQAGEMGVSRRRNKPLSDDEMQRLRALPLLHRGRQNEQA